MNKNIPIMENINKELSYEEYIKMSKEVFKNFEPKITKEDYEIFIKINKAETKLHKNVDEIIKEYEKEIDFECVGYYNVIEYCIKHIKESDEKLIRGFGIDKLERK